MLANFKLSAPKTLHLKTLCVHWPYCACMKGRPGELGSYSPHFVLDMGVQPSTSDWQELMDNSEASLSTLLPRVPWCDYAPVALRCNWLCNKLFLTCSPFWSCIPSSPTSASWDLLPNKLLAFQSLSQVCLGENSHPLQKSLLGFCRTSCHFFDFCSFSRTIIGKSRRCLAPPMPKIGAQQPRSHFSCSCRSPPLFLEGPLGLDQCCKHRATQ